MATFAAPSISARRKLATGQQRNPEGAQKIGPDEVVVGAGVELGILGKPLEMKAAHRRVTRHQSDSCGAHTGHTGKARQLILDGLQNLSRAPGRVPVHCRRNTEHHELFSIEAEIDACDIHQALREQPCRHEQRHRQRDLRSGERDAEARSGFRAGRLPGIRFQRRDKIRSRALQRRKQAEQQARCKRQCRRTQKHVAVELRAHNAWCAVRQDRGHRGQGPARNEKPACATHHRQQHRLEQQLSDDVSAAGSDRETHGHLRRATCRASEQQIRHIRTANQQHDRRHAKQQRQRLACFLGRSALPSSP